MVSTPISLGYGTRSGTSGVITLGFGTGGVAPPPTIYATVITLGFGQRTGTGGTASLGYGTGAAPPATVTVTGGVKKRFKLSDIRPEEKETLADFIKKEMRLAHADLMPPEEKPKPEVKAMSEKIAMDNMAIERANEQRRELIGLQNSEMLLLLLLASME